MLVDNKASHAFCNKKTLYNPSSKCLKTMILKLYLLEKKSFVFTYLVKGFLSLTCNSMCIPFFLGYYTITDTCTIIL